MTDLDILFKFRYYYISGECAQHRRKPDEAYTIRGCERQLPEWATYSIEVEDLDFN